jgi:hypothetical protein
MLTWQEVAWWVGHSGWCSGQQDEMTGNLNWDRGRRTKEECPWKDEEGKAKSRGECKGRFQGTEEGKQ